MLYNLHSKCLLSNTAVLLNRLFGTAFSFTLLPPAAATSDSNEKCRFIAERPVPSICKVHITFNKFEFDEDCHDGLIVTGSGEILIVLFL